MTILGMSQDSTRITKHNFTRTVIQDGGIQSDMCGDADADEM